MSEQEKKPRKKAAEVATEMESVEEAVMEAEAEPRIYIGPGFKDSVLSTYKIFADGVPVEYRGDPIHEPLFVTAAELNEARKEVAERGTRLNVLYQKAVEAHTK